MSTLPTLERELMTAAHRRAARPAWRRNRRHPGLLALIAVAAIGGGATAAAQIVRAPTQTGRPIPAAPNPPAPHQLGTRQGQLDALTQSATPTTTLPAQLQTNITQETVSGENPRLGRKALTTPWGDTFWVLPAADGKVCLLLNGGGGGCSPARQIASGTFNGVMPCHQGGAVYDGLLPNDASDISLTLDDGSQHQLTLTNNVWATQIPRNQAQPTTLNWTHNRTRQHAPTSPLPPAAPGSTDRCPS
jgi:hypothetical protein